MKKMKSMRWVALVFLSIIVVFFAGNIDLVTKSVTGGLDEEGGFVEFRNHVQETLKSDKFLFKNQFINFNGWFSRLIGKQVINKVILAENGMLFVDAGRRDMGLSGQKLEHMNSVLLQMDIPFVYVQTPYKVDINNSVLPYGIENYYNDNADSLQAELAYRGVETIDLRTRFSATEKDVEKNFYRTDHHWNYSAAFEAYQMLVPMIQNILKDETDVSIYLDKENWEKHVLRNVFLGSQGKRVGIYATELDDFEYYTPKFDTNMVMENVQAGKKYEGNFEECIIRKERLEELEKYFEKNPYAAFIGGEYGLVEHRNNLPAIDKKILIIKDSFVLPLQSFMATVFKEIDVVDLRHYTLMSLTELIYTSQPDIVLFVHTSIEQLPRYYYGYEEYDMLAERTAVDKERPLISRERITMNASYNPHYFTNLYQGLDADTAYTLDVGKLLVKEGDADYVTVKLYDGKANEVYATKFLDVRDSGLKWMFKTPDRDCKKMQIEIYCGEYGNTQGNVIEYEDVKLYKGWDISDR